MLQYADDMDALIFWVGLSVVVISYMTLWYGMAQYVQRYDVVDTAWGLGFIVVAWVSLVLRSNFGALQIVSALLVTAWGIRLTAHIADRNWRKSEDDHRYQELRRKWGSAEYKTYTNIFLLQGLLLMLVSLPMIAIAFSHHGPNALGYAGWIFWLGGIMFEAIADRQLKTFLYRRPKNSHAIMDKGLWQYSRHPNYFGEIVTWCGAALVAVSVGGWWGIAGALVITVLIIKVSGIPPLEKRYENDSRYAAYRGRVSVLVPMPPKEKA